MKWEEKWEEKWEKRWGGWGEKWCIKKMCENVLCFKTKVVILQELKVGTVRTLLFYWSFVSEIA